MSSQPTVRSRQMPFVLVNMAMTADGKIATANRAIHSFSTRRDLAHLYELRATTDAVMCGARTVEISRSILGTGGEQFRQQRLKRGLAEYNLRVIVSGSGSVNPLAEIFKKDFSPVIVLTTERAPKSKLRKLGSVADAVKICGEREIDFRTALSWLSKKWGVKRLLCEGGGDLNDTLLRAGLVDELHLTICPKIFGGRQSPTIADGAGFNRLARAKRLQIKSFRRAGNEVFTVFRRRPRL